MKERIILRLEKGLWTAELFRDLKHIKSLGGGSPNLTYCKVDAIKSWNVKDVIISNCTSLESLKKEMTKDLSWMNK